MRFGFPSAQTLLKRQYRYDAWYFESSVFRLLKEQCILLSDEMIIKWHKLGLNGTERCLKMMLEIVIIFIFHGWVCIC